MAGTPLKNLRMFERLCGKDALHNVILATTMWDEVDQSTGAKRENELRSNYWKPMLDCGSTTARFDGTLDSAWKIMQHLTSDRDSRHAVLLQEELVTLRKQLPETHAGQALLSTMEVLVKRQREMLEKIRAESKIQSNAAAVDALHKEYEDIQQQLEKSLSDLQTLKVSVGKRFKRFLASRLGVSQR